MESPYLDREVSELQFNERILGLAADAMVPLLERVRYLIISYSNLEQLIEERGRKLLPNPTAQARMVMLRQHQADVRELLETEVKARGLSTDFNWLRNQDIPELLYPSDHTHVPPVDWEDGKMWDEIPEEGFLKHHPYDDFSWVSDFVRNAAEDEEVKSISMTLYRVGNKSDIVDSLVKAAQSGKKVHVLLELKARLDEERNLTWASRLEFAGVKVSYGFTSWKTHAKLCVVKRKEGRKRPTLYSHICTGNYNTTTAGTYADFSLFTKDRDIGEDILKLFKWLARPGKPPRFKKLIISPFAMRSTLVDLIAEQAAKGYNFGSVINLKMNSLTDRRMVDELYKAADAGVVIQAIVRGACIVRPRPNLIIQSYVHRFLEHGRIFGFGASQGSRVFLSSADFKSNALDERVEQMTELTGEAREDAMAIWDDQWGSINNSWLLEESGEYVRMG